MPKLKRPIIQDPRGRLGKDFMTEKSITVKNPRINKGKATNIPTVFQGKERGGGEAQRRIISSGGIDPESGRKLKGFSNIKSAVSAAKKRSQSLNKSRSQDILKFKLKGAQKPKSKKSRK